jgi:hypothetical protein
LLSLEYPALLVREFDARHAGSWKE